ncbi:MULTISPECIES: hypothetical protein [Bacteroides]|nr:MULTISPECIES: hypothetical protein [Bacteroides]
MAQIAEGCRTFALQPSEAALAARDGTPYFCIKNPGCKMPAG